ncbi:hypothetical protein B0H13DRAFT_2416386 [Mycena leptocephala]|nr:hypothetical protein B0H13DRAFT_2416386 [Mycena leptocephala]
MSTLEDRPLSTQSRNAPRRLDKERKCIHSSHRRTTERRGMNPSLLPPIRGAGATPRRSIHDRTAQNGSQDCDGEQTPLAAPTSKKRKETLSRGNAPPSLFLLRAGVIAGMGRASKDRGEVAQDASLTDPGSGDVEQTRMQLLQEHDEHNTSPSTGGSTLAGPSCARGHNRNGGGGCDTGHGTAKTTTARKGWAGGRRTHIFHRVGQPGRVARALQRKGEAGMARDGEMDDGGDSGVMSESD